MSYTLILHDCGNICKVKVDKSRNIDKISYACNSLKQNLVCLLKSIRHGCASVNQLKQLIIGDDYHGVNILPEISYTLVGIGHALLGLKSEGLGNYTYGQYAETLGNACDNRSRTGTGSASHTAGDKYHVCSLKRLLYIICTFLCCLGTHLRLCACAESLGKLLTDLHGSRCLAELKCLLICINSYKFNSGNILIYHAVDGIVSCSAYTDNNYSCSRICLWYFNL